ncbi:MAG: hypothetical protein AAGB24_08965 [Bacteroidota bacterium]
MKKKTTNVTVSIFAGILFLFSAILIFRNKAEALQPLLLVSAGLMMFIHAFFQHREKETVNCSLGNIDNDRPTTLGFGTIKTKRDLYKIIGVTFGTVVVFFGLGFLVGKLLYHIIN